MNVNLIKKQYQKKSVDILYLITNIARSKPLLTYKQKKTSDFHLLAVLVFSTYMEHIALSNLTAISQSCFVFQICK